MGINKKKRAIYEAFEAHDQVKRDFDLSSEEEIYQIDSEEVDGEWLRGLVKGVENGYKNAGFDDGIKRINAPLFPTLEKARSEDMLLSLHAAKKYAEKKKKELEIDTDLKAELIDEKRSSMIIH
ncbi:MAG: hypothetical protein ACLFTQ_03970 [Candidatus Aenigmatarchaeota archaeon]